jgi:long-chain acyl-CoA synthetase
MKNKYFFDNLDKFGKKIAVIEENGKKITYKQLIKDIEKINLFLKKKKNLIFLLSDNSYKFIFSYYASLKNRSVVFLINNSLSLKKIDKLIKIYSPDYIFDTKNVILKDLKDYNNEKKINDLKIFKINKNKKNRFDSNLAQLLSTSGSTGSPKLIKQSYDNIYINTKDIAEELKIVNKDVLITTMSPSYTYGLSQINTHISMGATIVLNNKTVFEKSFWEKIKKYKVTNFGGVPFFFELLMKIKFYNFDLKSIKYITQAGGKLNPEILNELLEKLTKDKIKFYSMYGQTEAGARISILNNKYSKKKIGSIGKPIGSYKLWIEDDNKTIVKSSNKIGNLMCKGRNVMIGYASKKADLNQKQKTDIIDTGDLAYKDKDGFFYITGRSSRIIKPFGLRINLVEMENFLRKKMSKNFICIGNDKKINIYFDDLNLKSEVKDLLAEEFNLKKNLIHIYSEKEILRDSNGKIIYKIENYEF